MKPVPSSGSGTVKDLVFLYSLMETGLSALSKVIFIQKDGAFQNAN